MLKNYFKIAIRTLWRKKLFSFVNIFGLALGMAVSVLILSRLKENFDADHFHPHKERIVRILTKQRSGNQQNIWATVPQPLAQTFASVPFVEKQVLVRFGGIFNVQTGKGDIPVDINFTEPSFFNVFGFSLISGNASGLNSNPSGLFLSEKIAKKIFGKTDVVGQNIQFENIGKYTITGIIKDPQQQTHLPIEVVCSLLTAETLEKKAEIQPVSQNWDDYKHCALYARLNTEDNIALLNNKLKIHSRSLGDSKIEFEAQPVENITPWANRIQNDNNAGISYTGIKVMLFLIFSLTVLSAFNYISMSLARALSRAREIGVRKTMGAAKKQIIIQFLLEAVVVAFLALLLTVPFASILVTKIPVIRFKLNFDLSLLLLLCGYALLTGLLAGAVPATILSGLQPVKVLQKMKNIQLFRNVGLYKVLIVIQFSVTVMLMVFFVILTDYEKKNSATIDTKIPSNALVLNLKGEAYKNIKNEIAGISNVGAVLAGNWYYDAFKTGICNIKIGDAIQKLNYVSIDPGVVAAEGIKLKAGRNFPADMPENTEQFILLNEAAAKILAKKTPGILNKNIVLDSSNVQVIGIMPDQLAGNQLPLVYRYLPNEVSVLTIKFNPGSEAAVAAACKKIWISHYPSKPNDIYNLKQKYQEANTTEAIGFFGFFAFLIMIIAAMGILGIASYALEIRTKELGIRKVLGAGKLKLVWLITRGFGGLITIAGIIGIPAGLLCANFLKKVLGSNVDMGPLNVLAGFILVAGTGMLAVLSQTIRATLIDPVKVLKAE
ncbi:MAG: ABC transporter permease [Ferruginibacter sp.]